MIELKKNSGDGPTMDKIENLRQRVHECEGTGVLEKSKQAVKEMSLELADITQKMETALEAVNSETAKLKEEYYVNIEKPEFLPRKIEIEEILASLRVELTKKLEQKFQSIRARINTYRGVEFGSLVDRKRISEVRSEMEKIAELAECQLKDFHFNVDEICSLKGRS